MLVDDHVVVRNGLADFLLAFDDLELAGEASSGEEAVLMCGQYEPDVVLMDLVMEGMDGAEATRAIREASPDIQVIALTSYKEEDLVQQAIQAGAIGYLLKNVSAEELAEAIRDAYKGKPTLAPEAAKVLMNATTKAPRTRVRSHAARAGGACIDGRWTKQSGDCRETGDQPLDGQAPCEKCPFEVGHFQSNRSGGPGCEEQSRKFLAEISPILKLEARASSFFLFHRSFMGF